MSFSSFLKNRSPVPCGNTAITKTPTAQGSPVCLNCTAHLWAVPALAEPPCSHQHNPSSHHSTDLQASTACSKANFSPADQSHGFVSWNWKPAAYLKQMWEKVLESICLTWAFWQLQRAAVFHPVPAVHCTLNFWCATSSPLCQLTINPLLVLPCGHITPYLSSELLGEGRRKLIFLSSLDWLFVLLMDPFRRLLKKP